jgi:hypothetical protein
LVTKFVFVRNKAAAVERHKAGREENRKQLPLRQGIKRSNFIRAAAMEWMRINQPGVMAQIEAEAKRQYPFTKAAAVGPIHIKDLVDSQRDVQNRQAEERGGGDRDYAD